MDWSLHLGGISTGRILCRFGLELSPALPGHWCIAVFLSRISRGGSAEEHGDGKLLVAGLGRHRTGGAEAGVIVLRDMKLAESRADQAAPPKSIWISATDAFYIPSAQPLL